MWARIKNTGALKSLSIKLIRNQNKAYLSKTKELIKDLYESIKSFKSLGGNVDQLNIIIKKKNN